MKKLIFPLLFILCFSGYLWGQSIMGDGMIGGMSSAQILALLGYTPENVANKNTTGSLGTSDTYYPSQKAVKTYADTKIAGPGTVTSGYIVSYQGTTGLAVSTGINPATYAPLVSPTFTSASLGTSYLSTTKTAGSTGTTANLLVKIDSSGNVITATVSDVGILGVAVSTKTSGNSVEIATRGIINCIADNTTVIGNVAIVGTGTAGRCRDSNQTNSTGIPPSTQIVGKFLSVASVGNAASLQLYGPGHYGAGIVEKLATFAWDGGGSTLSTGTGTKVCTTIPYAATINGWHLTIDTNGAIVAYVFKDAWSTSAVPTTAIDASEHPTIGALAVGATGSGVGWTTSVTAYDNICAYVYSVTSATKANLVIHGTR